MIKIRWQDLAIMSSAALASWGVVFALNDLATPMRTSPAHNAIQTIITNIKICAVNQASGENNALIKKDEYYEYSVSKDCQLGNARPTKKWATEDFDGEELPTIAINTEPKTSIRCSGGSTASLYQVRCEKA